MKMIKMTISKAHSKTLLNLSSSLSSPLFKLTKNSFVFGLKNREIHKNHYEVLGVPYDSDLETIKKAYYSLAKKHHPDLNKETGSEEKFKQIKAAYEVIGDPSSRVSYDIEMNFSNDNSKYEKKTRYNKASHASQGPRTVKSFYGDKWSGYTVPKWVNLFSGKDMKSEYINRKDDDDPFITNYTDSRVRRFFIRIRLLFYLLFIFSIDIFFYLDNYATIRKYFLYKLMFVNNEVINMKENQVNEKKDKEDLENMKKKPDIMKIGRI